MKKTIREEEVSIKKIVADKEIFPRIMIDSYHVAELTKLIKEKTKIKAVTVYKDKKKNKYYLVDGFHRLEAHKRAGKKIIWCNICLGSYREAYIDACEANAFHGKRLTNEDKNRIVTRLLNDKKESEWSDCSIAEKCGVSQPFVGKVRSKLKSQNGYESPKKRRAANGTVVDISNIGKKQKE